MDLPREIALKILYDINEKGSYSNIALDRHLSANRRMRAIDRSFIAEMIYGSVRWKLTTDYIIKQFSSLKYERISPWIANILRLGIYQLLYMDKVPESAACNESVKLAKKYGHGGSGRFVNGMLRNISAGRDRIIYPDIDKDIEGYLSIKHSHPQWLVKKWVELFGVKFTGELMTANNAVPGTSLRVNTLRIAGAELMERFGKRGIRAEEGRYVKEALQVKGPFLITEDEEFQKGSFQAQDESSMLASKILDPKPGELVMDVCSAPGGKAVHMAQLMENRGLIIAGDIHRHRIALIEETAQRMGINIIKTREMDALVLDERYRGKADKVLVDAPCTGLGVIRRKPDIKWRVKDTDEKDITALQIKILNTVSKYVKPGGMMVYSTCTINPPENWEMAAEFIRMNGDFRMADIIHYIPNNLGADRASKGCLQLYPNVHGTDGFFIAKMEKAAKNGG